MNHHYNWLRSSGITLMELVVSLAILALLLLISLPSYTGYVQRTNRAEAIEALLSEANRQEMHYLVKRQFTERPPYLAASGKYRISVKLTNSPAGYSLRAEPLDSQEKDACGVFELDNLGRKTSQGAVSLCWGGQG